MPVSKYVDELRKDIIKFTAHAAQFIENATGAVNIGQDVKMCECDFLKKWWADLRGYVTPVLTGREYGDDDDDDGDATHDDDMVAASSSLPSSSDAPAPSTVHALADENELCVGLPARKNFDLEENEVPEDFPKKTD